METRDRFVFRDKTFYNKKIDTLNCFMVNSLIADTLAYDTLTAIVSSDELLAKVLISSDGYTLKTVDGYTLYAKGTEDPMTDADFGEPVWYYHNDNFIGKFYVDYVRRVGPKAFKFVCISGMGVLDRDYFKGGVYTGELTGDILADIIGDTIDFTVAAELADEPFYGFLPYDTKRECIHQLLFAVGGIVSKDDDGDVFFTFLTTEASYDVLDAHMYEGGDVGPREKYTGIDLYEHTYMALETDESKTLFDNT